MKHWLDVILNQILILHIQHIIVGYMKILDSGNEDEYNDYEDKKPKKSFEGFKF